MKPQSKESTKRIVDFEDSLLILHRARFFIRASIFVSISLMTVVYRLLPARRVIVCMEMLVIFVLWVLAAINAQKESRIYNEYVKCISPSNAQQLGLKPAPVRGFLSFFIKSWDVTCFFVPFVFFLGILLISPSRKLGGCVSSDKDFDKSIGVNRLCRVNYISEHSEYRLQAVQAWARDAYKGIKDWTSSKVEHLIGGEKGGAQVDSGRIGD